jgi:hypothetical protein
MHLTYHNPHEHASEVSTAKAEEAGASAGEIEISDEMVEAGINFMINEAFNTVSSTATEPEFIARFCRAILAAYRPASGGVL